MLHGYNKPYRQCWRFLNQRFQNATERLEAAKAELAIVSVLGAASCLALGIYVLPDVWRPDRIP